jgi:hypothetical protein
VDLNEQRERIEAERASRAQSSQADTVLTRGRAAYTDFDAVVNGCQVRFPEAMLRAIVSLPQAEHVEYALATRMEASKDIFMLPAARGHEYVRVSDRGMRTKLGIDATVPFAEQARFARCEFKPMEVAKPVTIEMDHYWSLEADLTALIPGVERTGGSR